MGGGISTSTMAELENQRSAFIAQLADSRDAEGMLRRLESAMQRVASDIEGRNKEAVEDFQRASYKEKENMEMEMARLRGQAAAHESYVETARGIEYSKYAQVMKQLRKEGIEKSRISFERSEAMNSRLKQESDRVHSLKKRLKEVYGRILPPVLCSSRHFAIQSILKPSTCWLSEFDGFQTIEHGFCLIALLLS
jgi:uncharacterized protein YukE